MSKEERFKTQFDGNKWLVADKENDTLLGGFASAKTLNEFVDKVAYLEAKLADSEKKNFELVATINLKEHKPAFCILADRDCEALGKIEQLKQQLAEKESEADQRYKDWQEEIRECDGLRVVLSEVRKQLAEKEKELKQLKLDLGMYKSVNEFLNRYGIEKAREVLLQTEKAKKQLKIEFAIAELEKIKDKFREIYDKNRKHHLSVVKCYEVVDEQIAELSNENERNGE